MLKRQRQEWPFDRCQLVNKARRHRLTRNCERLPIVCERTFSSAPDVSRKLIEQHDERECRARRADPGRMLASGGRFDRRAEPGANLGVHPGEASNHSDIRASAFSGALVASPNQNCRMSSGSIIGAALSGPR